MTIFGAKIVIIMTII